jgi:hypothetical protein
MAFPTSPPARSADLAHSHATLASLFSQAAAAAEARNAATTPETLAAARAALAAGTPEGLAEAAQLVSAWQLPEAPRLESLPDSLWGPYVGWLFAAPARPGADIAPALARHLARRCAEIADWMERNLAAPAVRAAADAYLARPAPPLALLPDEERLALQRARARILQRSLGRASAHSRHARPRRGRPLRLGVLHHRLDHGPAALATCARLAQIDCHRVEVHLLVEESTGGALELRLQESGAALHVLPGNLAAQWREMDSLALDCLLVGEDLSSYAYPLAHLVALRAAPLQLAFGPLTTGLPAVDLLVCGEADSPAPRPRSCSERVALLPGTTLAWDCSPDRPVLGEGPTRATLGLAEDQPLVVASADALLDDAGRAEFLRLLDAAPGSTLLLVPEPRSENLDTLRELLSSAAHPNLVLHEPAPADHSALAALLSLGDLCLDLSGPAASLALEAGALVLLTNDAPEAALLRVAGLEENILPDSAARLDEALRLIATPADRAARRARVASAMETLPRFADGYALAADFASLLEHAHDELLAQGPGRFRRERAPLRPPAPHSLHPGDLHAEALALLSAGRPERAVPCLLSALQRAGADPALWFDLARAYRAAGQSLPAIESLEASLRLHEENAAAWRLLCQLSAEAGNHDLAREALGIAATLAADHPELVGLRARLDG